jgi:hypothetical protein
MIELSARILALEAIVRTLVSEQAALWSEAGKGSAASIVDTIVLRAVRDIRNTPDLGPDEIREGAVTEVMAVIGDLHRKAQ